MRLITVAGPPACGKTSLVVRAGAALKARGATCAVIKFDCLQTRDDELYAAAGIPVLPSVSHIVPVHVGNPVHCKMISDMLLEQYGVYVQPINYPTVPKGTERLRFTPSPNHTDAMMDHLVAAMDQLFSHCNVARRPVAA